jgi:hypothetical protein
MKNERKFIFVEKWPKAWIFLALAVVKTQQSTYYYRDILFCGPWPDRNERPDVLPHTGG